MKKNYKEYDIKFNDEVKNKIEFQLLKTDLGLLKNNVLNNTNSINNLNNIKEIGKLGNEDNKEITKNRTKN